jgi:hypothetical protein
MPDVIHLKLLTKGVIVRHVLTILLLATIAFSQNIMIPANGTNRGSSRSLVNIPNPSELPVLPQSQIAICYDKPYYGITSQDEVSIAGAWRFINSGAGFWLSSYSADLMRHSQFNAMYGMRLGKPVSTEREQFGYGFFGGLVCGLHLRSFDESSFMLSDG